MRNLWGYISKPDDQIGTHSELEISDVKIDYAELRQAEQKIRELSSAKMFVFPTSEMAHTFEEVMGTLHGLLNVILELKENYAVNQGKLKENQRLKDMVAHHTEMIRNLEEQQSDALNRMHESRRKIIQQYQQSLGKVQQILQRTSQQLNELRVKNGELNEANSMLEALLIEKQQQIQVLQKKLALQQVENNNLLAVEDSSVQVKNTSGLQSMTIQTLFYYSKFRKILYSFIEPVDFANLALVNRHLHYICSKTFKKQFISMMVHNYQNKIEKTTKVAKDYQKIFDQFPMEAIRANAIKYLFFKIKPGGYMLPYFNSNQGVEEEKEEEKPKQSKWSIFKRKDSDIKCSYSNLKSDAEFKQVQKKVDVFFDGLFEISLPKDLKNFSNLMERQLQQLKFQLRNHDKYYQLLCLSKYLYLEIGELNNLLQVCFALLINANSELSGLKKKVSDLKENDKVLRNLIDGLANDRGEVEKRVWFLENQSLSTKRVKEQLESEVNKLRSLVEEKTEKLEKCEKQLQGLKVTNEKDRKERKRLEKQMEDIAHIVGVIQINDD